MCRHPAKGVQPGGKPIENFSGDLVEELPVSSAEEDILAVVASQRHVVVSGGNMKSMWGRQWRGSASAFG